MTDVWGGGEAQDSGAGFTEWSQQSRCSL
jgi:hypothetical protein